MELRDNGVFFTIHAIEGGVALLGLGFIIYFGRRLLRGPRHPLKGEEIV